MLTGKMVRVRHARDVLKPQYLNTSDASLLGLAEQLIDIFRGAEGYSRGQLEDELEETFGDDPGQLIHQGLTKLLEDRCDFDMDAGHPPDELREAVFRAAATARTSGQPFDRQAILESVAPALNLTAEQVDRNLFADLKSEQRLIKFETTTPERLLQRYNVALAQAILLRSRRVRVTIRRESPARYRQLMRQAKFHRLICDIERAVGDAHRLFFDGPLSLFSATNKYGLQLAMFLPSVLLCREFELEAEVLWGAQRKTKKFILTPADGLISHTPDYGTYVPPELGMFVDLFRKRHGDEWNISEETDIFPLGTGFWVPDFRLVHRLTKGTVLLEVLGFWRRSSAEQHLERLRKHIKEPFLLAVSDQLKIDEAELEGLPAGIHRFRQMPLPDEIARLAAEQLARR